MDKCDNPPCCNPAHLETGTHADNSADMIKRDRCGQKLRVAQVLAIRKLKGELPYTEIAAQFGIVPNTVFKIMSGQSWRHLLPSEENRRAR
jgi:hypothetical protein